MQTHDMITDCDHGLAQQMLGEWQNNNTPEINKLVKEFLDILDTVEESDSGRVFHPIKINSCRCMVTKRIDEILVRLKEIVKENQ